MKLFDEEERKLQQELFQQIVDMLPQSKPKTTIDVEIKMSAGVDENCQHFYHFDEMNDFIKKIRETHKDCDVHVKITGIGF